MSKIYKMIIVDDEPLTCEGLKNLMDWKSMNIEIVGVANSGKDGIELVNKVLPDIIIADIRMKMLDGLSMIEILRKNGYMGQIIIMSGYSQFEYAQKAISNNVCDYMLKPLTREKLTKAVQTAIARISAYSPKTEYIPEQAENNILNNVLIYIDNNFKEPITVTDISRMYFIEQSHLSRLFKKKVGMSFVEYVTRKRMEYAKQIIVSTDMAISEVASAVSYKDVRYFSNLFKKYNGVTPNEYRAINRK